MVLYSQAVTHPYLRIVRGSGNTQVNLLDLGPIHKDIREFCEKIINDPDLLVSEDAKHETATLDGKAWEDEKAVAAIRKLQGEGDLPYLASTTAPFFQGALTTWVRFSSEFAPGGTIDGLSLTECDLAWMPTTNDINKGALGAYRIQMRAKPTTTLLNYNAHAVCERNDTLVFMATMFTDDDYAYIRKVARRWDASGMERKWREEQAAFEKRLAEMKRKKEALVKQQAREWQERLSAVVFVDLAGINGLRVRDLDEQLDAWQLRGGVDDVIPKYKSHQGLLQDKRDLLRKVLLHVAAKGDPGLTQEDVSTGDSVEVWAQDGDEMEIEMTVDGDIL